MGTGYIKLYRQLQDCWIWRDEEDPERFTRAQAWIDLLLYANHREKKIRYDDGFKMIKRGQFLTSKRKLAERWMWNRRTVDKFLNLLAKDEMILLECTTKHTLITIVNYDIYQGDGVVSTPQDAPRSAPQDAPEYTPRSSTNKNDKNVKNDNNNNISSDEPVKDKKQPKVYSDNVMLNEAINDFIKHRRKIKAPMTDRAIELFIKKLNGMTSNLDEQVEIINTAIERGWKGIYPIADKPNTKKPRYDAADKEERLDDLKAIENMYLE